MNIERFQNRAGSAAAPNTTGTTPAARRVRRGRGASSLVEVLIVIVIILIGVFAAIQIFPIGFGVLQKSESRLRADRFARNITEGLTADSSSLPESITFSYYANLDPGTGAATPLPNRFTVVDQDPDNFGTYLNDPGNKLYFSDVNKFRYVKNEPVRVPLATATAGAGYGSSGVGSVHFVQFGPIYMDQTVGNWGQSSSDPATPPANTNEYLSVTSDRLVGTSVTSTGGSGATPTRFPLRNFATATSNSSSYAIDYGDDDNPPAILFPAASKDRSYTIQFTFEYKDGSGNQQTATSELIYDSKDADADDNTNYPLSATGKQGWITLKRVIPPATKAVSLVKGNSCLPGSESVTRNFIRLPAVGTSSNWDPSDPYQYKLLSSNVGFTMGTITSGSVANLGVIAFNPAGANYTVTVPGGTKPFTALASYSVLDWHILHDDVQVAAGDSNGVSRIHTTLPNIRTRTDETTDLTATGADRTQVYPGLFPQQGIYHPGDPLPPEAISPDIEVFSLSDASGTVKQLDIRNENTDPGSTPGDYANLSADLAKATNKQPYYWINHNGRQGTYPSGTIYINTNRVGAGSKVRILYKAQGDWAVAFQKAAQSYKVNLTGTGTIDTRPKININVPHTGTAESFGIEPGTAAAKFGDAAIYFQRTELNKSVTAVIEYTTATGTTRLASRQFTINNASTDGAFSYARVTDFAPEVGGNTVTGWAVHGTISGVSLKTRVIYQDEQNGRNPYRISDLETFVTQGQQAQ